MKTNIFLMKKNTTTEKLSSRLTNNIYINKAKDINKHIIGPKTEEINIYDITKKQKGNQRKKTQINNHINKTGENPLITKKQTKIKFYDTTNAYQKSIKGITTTCLGKRYKKEYKKFKNPSTFICHVVFILRARGYKKIKGWLIPNL